MDNHPNATLLRRFYDAFAQADYFSAVTAFFRPDVAWHISGNNPLARDYRGTDAVLNAMRSYGERSGHTLQLDTRSIFADDDHAIAVHWASGERAGFTYSAHEIDVFHVEDDRIVEFWSFSEDQSATDTFWS
jgi:ketosteroid isomerase-like protein